MKQTVYYDAKKDELLIAQEVNTILAGENEAGE